MAVGTVSGIDPSDNWQLITSQAASGSSVTFSSLSGYKKILLTIRGLSKSAASHMSIQLNNDTSYGNYACIVSDGDVNQFIVGGNTAAAIGNFFWIDNVDKSMPHRVSVNSWGPTSSDHSERWYLNPVPITSIKLFNWQGGTQTWTAGTIELWGIPA